MDSEPFSLSGKTILITGASSGIGAACAVQCAKAGASVILSGRNSERLNAVFSSLPENQAAHRAIPANLAKDEDIQRLLDALPPIDGFVHCAGITKTLLLRFARWSDVEEQFSINLFSAIKITQGLLKKRGVNKGGSLVYLASTNASVALPGNGLYSATKAGLAAFVRSVAVETAPRGIRANTISPGLVETPMTDYITKGDPEALKKDKEKYLLGYGKPEDIALAAQYFLSDASRWVTATNFVIDGGFLNNR